MIRFAPLAAICCLSAAAMYADDVSTSSATTPSFDPTSAVMLSSPSYCFGIEFDALVMQPTGSNTQYAAEAYPLPAPSPHWKIHGIDTDYHFGFDVGLFGVFRDANTTVSLNWEHFHSSDSDSRTTPSENMIGPFFEIGPDAATYKKASGEVTFHFDQVALDAGIFVALGSRVESTLFAGVDFARIKQTLKSTYSSAENVTSKTITVPSTFTGAGPQIGVDFTYKIVKGFKLTGNATASLLVGSLQNKTTYDSYTPALSSLGITPPNHQTTTVSNKTQVVPGFEGNLGLCYVANFLQDYMCRIEAGYKVQVYLNAIQSADIGSEVVTPPVEPDTVGVFARTFRQTLSNFALAGPYARIELAF